jgi:O-antigen/teichoic acid export membrane protein
VLATAALPVVVVVALPDERVATLITLMAVGLLVPCVAVAAVSAARAVRSLTVPAAVTAGRTLLNFGSRRVPGELAAIGLFALPPVVAAHFVPLDRVAYLTVGLYVVAVVSISFQPLGLVLLPALSRLWAINPAATRQHVARLCAFALHSSLFVTPALVLFADIAARAWLGSGFADAGPIIRITTLPLVLFMVHLILRTSLDAVAVKSYNSRNEVIALAAFAVAATVLLATHATDPLTSVAWSLAIGLLTLGALTFATVQRLFGVAVSNFALPVALPLAAASAALGYTARSAIGSEASLRSVLLIVLVELVLASAYVLALVRAGVSWPAEFRTRLLRPST